MINDKQEASSKRGRLFIISGPSGAGKSTLINHALEDLEGFVKSVSVTTRPKRNEEKDQDKYYFVSEKRFEEMISLGELLEYATYCNYYYGTPKSFVEEMLKSGKNVILEIEVQGAMQVREKIRGSYMIFVLPPKTVILEERLKKRNTESQEEIDKRLKTAVEELKYQKYYDCIIVNNDYNEALLNLKYVLNTQKEL